MAGLCEGGNEPACSLKVISQARIEPEPERNFRPADKRLNRLSHAGGFKWSLGRLETYRRTHRYDTTVHDVIRLLIPALYKNQSDSLMAADGDCHHLCKLMAPVRRWWSINDVIGGIRNTVMP
ncbi:hypothetical protein ANN_12910 [Periplaneta americana]|uniref:Uncharacterized protein n=1 Tax=Periplaneta americana TaxID=6978 RepID=A0ABQ8THX0_PERAM|nr:hypothetical protein ANN_12910 [Periplaneta americana]